MSPIFLTFIKVFEPATTKRFVLSAAELASLPKKERLNFKPIASNSTIRDGTISPDEFVFFPYDSSGLTITTEEELAKRVPRYFERWLGLPEN